MGNIRFILKYKLEIASILYICILAFHLYEDYDKKKYIQTEWYYKGQRDAIEFKHYAIKKTPEGCYYWTWNPINADGSQPPFQPMNECKTK